MFVSSYRVNYSTDGYTWRSYKNRGDSRSKVCPVPRCSFLFMSRVIPRLSRPALSLSCPVPRCPFLVSSRVIPCLSRPALSLSCPVPRLFVRTTPEKFENRGFTLKTRQLFQSVHGFFAFVFEDTRAGTSHDYLDGIVLEKLLTYWREKHFFLSCLPILPRCFYTRPRPFVRILTVARVRRKYDCFAV